MSETFFKQLKAEIFIMRQTQRPGFVQIEVHAGDRAALTDRMSDLAAQEQLPLIRIDKDAIERCSEAKDGRGIVREPQSGGSPGLSLQLPDALSRIGNLSGIFLFEFGEYDQSNAGLIGGRLKRLSGEKLVCFVTKPGRELNIPYLEEKMRGYALEPPDAFEIAGIARKLPIGKDIPRFPEIAKLCLGLDREAVSELLLRVLVFERTQEFSSIAEAIHRSKAEYFLRNTDVLEYRFVGEDPRVYGYDGLIRWLRARYEKILQGECRRAVLLYGIPGTGKTSAAFQAAYELGLPLIRFHFSALREKFQGEAERKFRHALRLVERMAPCIVLGDEYDKTLSAMAQNSGSDGGVGSSLLSIWLEWIEKPVPVIFIATSNSLDIRPEEMRRFEPFFADVPERMTAAAILWGHLVKNDVALSYEHVREVAEKMAGIFSGDLIRKTADDVVTEMKSGSGDAAENSLQRAYERHLNRAVSLHLSTRSVREQARVHGLKRLGM